MPKLCSLLLSFCCERLSAKGDRWGRKVGEYACIAFYSFWRPLTMRSWEYGAVFLSEWCRWPVALSFAAKCSSKTFLSIQSTSIRLLRPIFIFSNHFGHIFEVLGFKDLEGGDSLIWSILDTKAYWLSRPCRDILIVIHWSDPCNAYTFVNFHCYWPRIWIFYMRQSHGGHIRRRFLDPLIIYMKRWGFQQLLQGHCFSPYSRQGLVIEPQLR